MKNNEQNLYLHIEGMDLVGKTTIANELSKRLPGRWIIRQKCLVDNNPIYLLTEKLRKEQMYTDEVIGFLYTIALLGTLQNFKRPITPTIQESTILLRSLSYHKAKGHQTIVEILLQKIAPFHPRFDFSVVLTSDINVRKERLKHRTQIGEHDLLIHRAPDFAVLMETYLLEYSTKLFNSIVIDTTNYSVIEVTEMIIRNVIS